MTVERLRLRLAELEAEHAALAVRLRASDLWQQLVALEARMDEVRRALAQPEHEDQA